MPSDDRRPVAGDVFSKRDAMLLAGAAMTVVAILTVLLSRLTLDDAYVEGYLSGLALLHGAGPDEIIGARRRQMILEMLSSPRFQREYVFATRRTIGWTVPPFCAAISGRPIPGATRWTACRSPRPRSRSSRAGELTV